MTELLITEIKLSLIRMKKTIYGLTAALGALAFVAVLFAQQSPEFLKAQEKHKFAVVKTDAEWRKSLSPAAYKILRQKDTEEAYSGEFWENHEAGTYYCAGCGQALFSSKTKFDSHTGWPSFWEPVKPSAVVVEDDHTFGMDRTEVLCSRCGGHLGHVFDDGPRPTGLRYCINSPALKFKKAK